MANPNPARITDELWRFRTACLDMEPGTADEDSGIYANKPGYHNTRSQNDPENYSVRDAPDQKGPGDKAAAWDWTFQTAQNGDYSRISIYGKRMLIAFNEEDDRCNVLREFLGQTDMDATPEGLDFRYRTKRTPDDTHKWHIHWSFVRAYVAVPGALDCVLSILKGETLDAYLARGGKLYKADGTGEYDMAITDAEIQKISKAVTDQVWARDVNPAPEVTQAAYRALDAAQKAAEAALAVINQVKALVEALQPANGEPVDLQPVLDAINSVKSDTQKLVDSVKAAGVAVE